MHQNTFRLWRLLRYFQSKRRINRDLCKKNPNTLANLGIFCVVALEKEDKPSKRRVLNSLKMCNAIIICEGRLMNCVCAKLWDFFQLYIVHASVRRYFSRFEADKWLEKQFLNIILKQSSSAADNESIAKMYRSKVYLVIQNDWRSKLLRYFKITF